MLHLGVNQVSNAIYHGDRNYLSSSVIKLLAKDVAEYHRQYILGQKVPFSANQAALDEGSFTHSILLEPENVQAEYAIYPGKRRSGSEYQQFAQNHPGKIILLESQAERCFKLQTVFNSQKDYAQFIQGGVAELSLCVELQNVPIKTRFDYINIEKGFISDVKTTSYGGELESFQQVVENLDYGLSAALYLQAAELYYEKPFDFYFIVLSKKDITANIYKLSQATRFKANRKIATTLSKYKKCKESGIWTEEQATKFEPNFEILEV